MAITGLNVGRVERCGRSFLTHIDGRQSCQYVKPFGGVGGTHDHDEIWYLDDRRETGMVLTFLREDVVCISFLGNTRDDEGAIRKLLAVMLDDAQEQHQPVVVRVDQQRAPLFASIGFITLCVYMDEQPEEIMVHTPDPITTPQLVAMRNVDGNNPALLARLYPCGSPYCPNFGHYICKQCRREVFCSRRCHENNRMQHLRVGMCKPADHVVRRLLERLNAAAPF